jgi:hypothetical protein
MRSIVDRQRCQGLADEVRFFETLWSLYKRTRTPAVFHDLICVEPLPGFWSLLSPFFSPRKRTKPCRQILSTIGTTPSCCQSHIPLHHISLDQGGGVVGVLHVCISQRRRHLRCWIGSDREEEMASTTTSSMFSWTFPLCDFFKGIKISSVSLIDYIS